MAAEQSSWYVLEVLARSSGMVLNWNQARCESSSQQLVEQCKCLRAERHS